MKGQSRYDSQVVIDRNQLVLIRPIQESDAPICVTFFTNLGAEDQYCRFHNRRQCTLEEASKYCSVDYKDNFVLIAQAEGDEAIIAHAQYYRVRDSDMAEIAIVVNNAYQGKGIGAKLMQSLAQAAFDNGITSFVADILRDNNKALSLIRHFDPAARLESEIGSLRVRTPVAKILESVK